MDHFSPLINLLVLLSALSMAAERLANLFKPAGPGTDDRQHERRISRRVLAVSLVLALAVKADFFEILARLDAPWETLGWVSVTGSRWLPSGATATLPRFLYALGGTTITGLSLGFGSKFWHDILDIVYATRETIRGAAGRDERKREPDTP